MYHKCINHLAVEEGLEIKDAIWTALLSSTCGKSKGFSLPHYLDNSFFTTYLRIEISQQTYYPPFLRLKKKISEHSCFLPFHRHIVHQMVLLPPIKSIPNLPISLHLYSLHPHPNYYCSFCLDCCTGHWTGLLAPLLIPYDLFSTEQSDSWKH